MAKVDDDPTSVTSVLIRKALEKNIQYLRHYKNLISKFKSEEECFEYYKQNFKDKMNVKIEKKLEEGTCLTLRLFLTKSYSFSSEVLQLLSTQ